MNGLICVAISLPGLPLRAWMFSRLWLWFAVPAFGVKPISNGLAYGVAVLIASMTFTLRNEDLEDKPLAKDIGRTIAAAYIMPLIFLGSGWMIKEWWA
jgi:hypothetical protein